MISLEIVHPIVSLFLNNPYFSGIGGTIIALIFTYILSKLSKKSIDIDFRNQAKVLNNEENSRISHLQPKSGFMTTLYSDALTLYECLLRGEKVSSNGNCLGWQENGRYKWLRYSEVKKRSQNFGYGLKLKGCERGTYVGIFSKNCIEYAITEHACYSQSMVVVPVYNVLGSHVCRLIINEAGLGIIICDDESKVLNLLDQALYMPKLKSIILINLVSNETLRRARSYNINIFLFREIEQEGEKAKNICLLTPLPDDLAAICYTGGTTGNPKGVMLTHGNIIANVSAVLFQMGDVSLKKKDIYLSFLPMAHMFERCCQIAIFMVGGKIGFFKGDIYNLSEDLLILKPTVFPCVPRVLNIIYSNLKGRGMNILKEFLFNFALAYKKEKMKSPKIQRNNFLEWLMFRKAQNSLGGRVRLIMIGSGCSSESVVSFLKCVLNCVIIEGYGQTECVGPCTMSFSADNNGNHAGPPLPCCSIKLIDVPDMDYFIQKNGGEICVKGPIVCKGYLNDSEESKTIIDENDWLHTGDIGIWLPNGTLQVIDRKKHVFKLSYGESIFPEKIENVYNSCEAVSQIFVYGENEKPFLVAIVVPDLNYIQNWCKQYDVEFYKNIIKRFEVRTQVLNDLILEGKIAGLKPYEQIKNIYLTFDAFTVENNLLTPTMKIKRRECSKYFNKEINMLFKELN